MLHEIVIRFDEDVANELRQRPADYKVAEQVVSLVAEAKVELIDQIPEATGEPSFFFSILIPDADFARQLAEKLKSCAGVNSVYVKPQGGPPG